MGNGLCPHCGCLMGEETKTINLGEDYEPDIVEITYTCPCCEYTETTYED